MGSNGTFSGGRQRVALAWTVRFATLFPVASEPHRSKVQEVLSNIRLCMWLIFVSETHADGDRARAAARPPAGPRGRAVSSTGGYLGEASAHMRGTATRNNSKLKITQHLRELKLKIKPPGSRAGPPQLRRVRRSGLPRGGVAAGARCRHDSFEFDPTPGPGQLTPTRARPSRGRDARPAAARGPRATIGAPARGGGSWAVKGSHRWGVRRRIGSHPGHRCTDRPRLLSAHAETPVLERAIACRRPCVRRCRRADSKPCCHCTLMRPSSLSRWPFNHVSISSQTACIVLSPRRHVALATRVLLHCRDTRSRRTRPHHAGEKAHTMGVGCSDLVKAHSA